MGGSSPPSSPQPPPPPTSLAAGGAARQQQPVGDEVAHFKSIPWCAQYLSSAESAAAAASAAAAGGPATTTTTTSSSSLVLVPVFSRVPNPPHLDDTFFNTTLKTRDTIPAFVCFYPGPEDRRAYLPRVQALVTLGSLVSGYEGVSHGGLVASVFDEALGLIAPGSRWRGWKNDDGDGGDDKEEGEGEVVAEKEPQPQQQQKPQGEGGGGVPAVVTAYLTTRYLRRVTLPGTYLVTVWLVRKEGRKVFVEGVMEDEHGVKVAGADALFVEAKEKL